MATLTTWYNPHGNDNLLNISSGTVATEAVSDDLLSACIGVKNAYQFSSLNEL